MHSIDTFIIMLFLKDILYSSKIKPKENNAFNVMRKSQNLNTFHQALVKILSQLKKMRAICTHGK